MKIITYKVNMAILQRTKLENIVIAHFLLSVIGSMGGSNASYVYMNVFLLIFGIWGIISQDSFVAVHMFLRLNVLCIFLDLIVLICRAVSFHADHHGGDLAIFIFANVFAIINFLARPLTSRRLYTIYQERGGQRTCAGSSWMSFLMKSDQGHGVDNDDTPGYEDI